MDDLTNLAERANGSLQSPVLVIIAQLVLTRTCIIKILGRELASFEIIELATTNDLGRVSGRDVRLVLLDIGDKPIIDPSIEEDLGLIVEFCPEAFAELPLGLPNKLIAAKLNLSENTVKMHIQHIMRKFSAHNRTEAVLRWRTLIEA